MKYIKLISLVVLLLGILTSCEQEDIRSFEAEPAVNFTQTTQTYSFLANPDDAEIIEIPVRIMGNAVDYDRNFDVEVIEETGVPEGSYEIMGGYVEAGEFEGVLEVKVFNAPVLENSEASITLELTNSEDFRAGNIGSRQYILNWTDQVVVPAWTYFRYFFTAVPSPAAYRAIVESTGITQFTLNEYRALGPVGAQAMATTFGNYVKQWNLDHPDNPLIHDGGPLEGELIVPLYYSKSLYD